jgi:hypothetical protein
MSRLARTLVLGRAAGHDPDPVAQAQLTGDDAVELFRRGERASQDQPTSDSVKRAALAQER